MRAFGYSLRIRPLSVVPCVGSESKRIKAVPNTVLTMMMVAIVESMLLTVKGHVVTVPLPSVLTDIDGPGLKMESTIVTGTSHDVTVLRVMGTRAEVTDDDDVRTEGADGVFAVAIEQIAITHTATKALHGTDGLVHGSTHLVATMATLALAAMPAMPLAILRIAPLLLADRSTRAGAPPRPALRTPWIVTAREISSTHVEIHVSSFT